MHTEPHEVHHPKNRHLAERFEYLIQVIMVIAVVVLGVGLIWGLMNTGGTPSYLQ